MKAPIIQEYDCKNIKLEFQIVDAEKMKAMKTQPSMKEKLIATLKSNTNFNATNLGMGIVEDDPDDIM